MRGVTVLIDDARWQWRGLRWAHLVSDESYDELHEFARLLGKRRLGFQGDHYDVDQVDHERAVAFGATPVESRELVRRLRAAGLRNRTDKPAWERLQEWAVGEEIVGLPSGVADALRLLDLDSAQAQAGLYRDLYQTVLLLDLPPGFEFGSSSSAAWIGEPRADGWRSIEIFVSR